MFGLFGKSSTQMVALCKWCPPPKARTLKSPAVPASIATGEGHMFPSLCAECSRKAWGLDAAKVAQAKPHEEEFSLRAQALRDRLFSAADTAHIIAGDRGQPSTAPQGFELRHREFMFEYAKLTAERDSKMPSTFCHPEAERMQNDPHLLAELAAYVKESK